MVEMGYLAKWWMWIRYKWIRKFVDSGKVDSKKCGYRKRGLGKRVDWTICGLKQKWIQ